MKWSVVVQTLLMASAILVALLIVFFIVQNTTESLLNAVMLCYVDLGIITCIRINTKSRQP